MRINRGLLHWGVFLIALGAVPLAVQQGWANAALAGDLWRLWPLILVGIGLGLILRWTPLAWLGGALVAGTFGLIFGALVAGGVSGISSACIGPGGDETSVTEEQGVASLGTFQLDVELSCGDLSVTRETSATWTVVAQHEEGEPPVIEGSSTGLTVRQSDESEDFFTFAQQSRNGWAIGLPASAPIAAGVTLNAADGNLDLGPAPVASLSGTFNASDVDLDLADATTPTTARVSLTFNASSGTLSLPDASIGVEATLTASSLEICVPESAELRIDLESTLSSDDLDDAGLVRQGSAWQTPGSDTAATRIDLSITSTVSSISLRRVQECP